MSSFKALTLFTLALLIQACGGEKINNRNYALTVASKNNKVQNGQTVAITLKEKRNFPIDSIVYTLNGERLQVGKETTIQAVINSPKLGRKVLKAQVYTDQGMAETSTTLIVLSPTAPKVFGFDIVNSFPHKIDAYTQGLEFVGDTLYESNGQRKRSNLRKLDYITGNIYKEVKLADNYFGEGLTVLDDKVYQLTWQAGIGLIYDKNTLQNIGQFDYGKSKEGWGLTNDGSYIYKSDGTSKIWRLDPKTLEEIDFIEATDNTSIRNKFNELEFIDGKIYANYYQLPLIAIINPDTGAIEANINLKPLLSQIQTGLDKDNEVLNGIAYKKDEKRLFVTGKHWNTLFEITIKN